MQTIVAQPIYNETNHRPLARKAGAQTAMVCLRHRVRQCSPVESLMFRRVKQLFLAIGREQAVEGIGSSRGDVKRNHDDGHSTQGYQTID
jgi:hypothetical protein